MLAFSIWSATWLVLITYLFVVVLIMLFSVVIDLLCDQDLSAVAKVVWIVAHVVLPLLGLLAYMIARGPAMAERTARQQVKAKQSFDSYVREVAGGGAATELEKASAMHDAGRLPHDTRRGRSHSCADAASFPTEPSRSGSARVCPWTRPSSVATPFRGATDHTSAVSEGHVRRESGSPHRHTRHVTTSPTACPILRSL